MDFLPSYRDDLYLAHHGIKGMKWGVRRYQNSDGSYTPQGKARRNKESGKSFNGKKAAKIAGTVAGTVAIGAAAYYVQNNPQVVNTVQKLLNKHGNTKIDFDDLGPEIEFSNPEHEKEYQRFVKRYGKPVSREDYKKVVIDPMIESQKIRDRIEEEQRQKEQAAKQRQRERKAKQELDSINIEGITLDSISDSIRKISKQAAYEEAHGGMTKYTRDKLKAAKKAKKKLQNN